MRPLVRRHPLPIAAAALGCGAFVLAAALRGEPRAALYVVVLVVVGVVVHHADKRGRFGRRVAWALAAWAVLHTAGGLVPCGEDVLYNAWLVRPVLKYDQAVHAYAYAVTTVSSAAVLGRGRVRDASALTATLVAVGLGSVNEVVEFLSTAALPLHVGGEENLGWDLVFNLVGSTIAGVWLAVLRRSRQD